jgi:hypothetical protein
MCKAKLPEETATAVFDGEVLWRGKRSIWRRKYKTSICVVTVSDKDKKLLLKAIRK